MSIKVRTAKRNKLRNMVNKIHVNIRLDALRQGFVMNSGNMYMINMMPGIQMFW